MREVDALDGVMGKVAGEAGVPSPCIPWPVLTMCHHSDNAGIQFHVLNRSKGPAVWGPRAQMDRKLYKQHMQNTLFNYPNLDVRAANVFDLSIGRSDDNVAGSSYLSGLNSIHGVKLGGSHPALLLVDRNAWHRSPRDRRDHIMYQRRPMYWDISIRRNTHWYLLFHFFPSAKFQCIPHRRETLSGRAAQRSRISDSR